MLSPPSSPPPPLSKSFLFRTRILLVPSTATLLTQPLRLSSTSPPASSPRNLVHALGHEETVCNLFPAKPPTTPPPLPPTPAVNSAPPPPTTTSAWGYLTPRVWHDHHCMSCDVSACWFAFSVCSAGCWFLQPTVYQSLSRWLLPHPSNARPSTGLKTVGKPTQAAGGTTSSCYDHSPRVTCI